MYALGMGESSVQFRVEAPISVLRAMSMPTAICVWQHRDDRGTIMPWYTKPMLDVLVTWPLEEWSVFEYGAGWSTLWYASRCRSVVSVDNNAAWVDSLRKAAPANVAVHHHDDQPSYIRAIDAYGKFDLIIVDGAWRECCAPKVMEHIKPGGYVILDNAEQDGWLRPMMETFKYNEHHSYPMPNHPHWRTDYWKVTVFDRWDDVNQEAANRAEEKRRGQW